MICSYTHHVQFDFSFTCLLTRRLHDEETASRARLREQGVKDLALPLQSYKFSTFDEAAAQHDDQRM